MGCAEERRPIADVYDFNAQIIEEFRANAGRVGGSFDGTTVLLPTTKGAKSGRERVYAEHASINSGFADDERMTDRIIPVVRLVRS